MSNKKYQTEEERKAVRREYYRQYYLKNKEKRLEERKQYYQQNKEKEAIYKKKWKEDNPNYFKQHYQENKEEILEKQKKWRDDNPNYFKEWRKTPIGRANKLLYLYKKSDQNTNKGECTLTAQWIVENIFSQPCHYCGESDWHKIGCDRIDNSKPHTPNNVVPCCARCNNKRGTKEYNEFIKIIKEKNT